MKIVSLNGWGGKLHEDLLAYVKATEPDILCLQEVVHSPESRKDWLTYRDNDQILPQRANFFSEVACVLPDHIAFFCPAAQGVLWDDEESVSSQWGLATFVHRSFPIIGQAQGFVHKDYSPVDYGEHPRSRCAHGVRVYDYEANRSVSVTHMHGLRDLNGKMDTPERLAQARRLLELSRQVSATGDLIVMCGDFNVEPSSQTLALMSEDGWTELVTGRGFQSTRTSHYKKQGRFADYMLVNREEAVRAFDVVDDPEVSDHCPLVLVL
ncbi:endonuclease/exonuclease/phosphatase family protein (plasmid) [Agrobacterium sp. MA01]|uniref:endonuclease/exonuclease/phosphatase family protein n=1 Tax=Agrobacterium sp. MA01 TaxID=2664893 RepID=UPI00129B42E5|nr:endonuclease/exonuclease/phosphatase family protein [Agrobacterium sp. MA01]QGG93266.1 endonuclease/exonuclease/phosphatase family protein [Agrobacterium sp. MA01]